MGGIREKGIILSCDKCENDVEVVDQQAIDFYKAFSSRDDRARLMFMGMTSGIEGREIGSVGIRYEWLCPDCLTAINTALSAATKKTTAGTTATGKRRGRPPKSASAPVEAPAAADPVAAQPSEEKEIDENELFD